jgi:cyclase
MVLSIEAKRQGADKREAYTDNGREHTGLDVIEWVQQGLELGAGEVLITSIDQEGTRKGFDLDLIQSITDVVNVPVIASGGLGTLDHLTDVIKTGHADAVAVADALHYERLSLVEMRDALREIPAGVLS